MLRIHVKLAKSRRKFPNFSSRILTYVMSLYCSHLPVVGVQIDANNSQHDSDQRYNSANTERTNWFGSFCLYWTRGRHWDDPGQLQRDECNHSVWVCFYSFVSSHFMIPLRNKFFQKLFTNLKEYFLYQTHESSQSARRIYLFIAVETSTTHSLLE